ncbi:MAG: hypothetical protein WCK32_05590 [Chlorobiaceae bacterium]
MFNDKPYAEVNREERFFCFLFAHALLMSRSVRFGFAKLAKEKYNVHLDPDALEVYVEAAALRDYWFNLGDPVSYSEKMDKRRREVLEQILEYFKVPSGILDKHALFKTSMGKLWSPSHWNINALKNAGLDKYNFIDGGDQYNLIDVKWAFNAKPDIVLISPESMLVIEAKLESAEGCNAASGYGQYKIQRLIMKLWKLLIPKFANKQLQFALLKVKGSSEKSIIWSKLTELIAKSDADNFTRESFDILKKRYYP